MKRLLLIVAAVVAIGFARSAVATVLSVGTFPATPVPAPAVAIPSKAFFVPIEAAGAAGLQQWQFDLTFDPTVVQEFDPGDGSSGIYGAAFTPADPNSVSFILAGFPLNASGLVSGVAGSYPDLLDGVSGDGVLAYILFEFVSGQENGNPDFAVANVSVTEVLEPGSFALLAFGVLLIPVQRKFRLPDQRGEK